MFDPKTDSRRALAMGVLFEGGLGVLACALGWLLDVRPWAQFLWSARDAGLGAAAAVPLAVLFFAALHSRLQPLVRIRRFLDEVFRPLFVRCTLAELALLSALAGLGEEMLFRGLLQTSASRALGTTAGLVVASVAFGLAHSITPTYAVVAGVIGGYLGWLWLATGNLLVPVVAHGLYDFVALVYLLRRQVPPAETDGAGG